MTNTSPGLTLVVVAFNERANLENTVTEAIQILETVTPDPQLILVDDGSSDGTGALADDLARRRPWAMALHHDVNQGMGAALKTGYAAATREFVTFLPGDGQIPAEGIAVLLRSAVETGADLVLSRYEQRRDGLHRTILSKGLRLTTRIVSGTKVRSEGPYLVRKEILEKVPLRSDSFFLNLELPIRAAHMGLHIEEVVLQVRPRTAGNSKVVSVRKIASVLGDMVALRIRMWHEHRPPKK